MIDKFIGAICNENQVGLNVSTRIYFSFSVSLMQGSIVCKLCLPKDIPQLS